jgi:hypothetical protein
MATNYDELRKILEQTRSVASPFTDGDWKKVRNHLDSLTTRKNKKPSYKIRKENIATTLAFWIPIGYMAILLVVLIYVPLYNWAVIHLIINKNPTQDDLLTLKDTFQLVNTPLSPIVGVALGHFFNNRNNN